MTKAQSWSARVALLLAVAVQTAAAGGSSAEKNGEAVYEGMPVRIGDGTARTVVRADSSGKLAAIGVVMSADALDGLPQAAHGQDPNFTYVLHMPKAGPRTVVDHVVINWESAGHPPQKVYDVPHFDFHFYVVGSAERMKVRFRDANDSAAPAQQPPASLIAPGYVLPPGTAVPRMGVHAINPASQEFQGKPFAATFIYGYYNKRQTFIEPMASLDWLKTRPDFSAEVARPEKYSKIGAYPSRYSIRYDASAQRYEVMLEALR